MESLLRNGVNAIQDVPIERWDPLFWDADPKAKQTYNKIGGFVEGFDLKKRFQCKVASQYSFSSQHS